MGGLAQACINLDILAGDESAAELKGFEPMTWYPVERYYKMMRFIENKFQDPGPIKEKVGIEMMRLWYHFGPGKEIVKKGVEFLEFQTSSQGFYSVVRGQADQIGSFTLESLDTDGGKAVVVARNPFDADQQRGVLIGGLSAPGDLVYVNVDNTTDPGVYHIEFH